MRKIEGLGIGVGTENVTRLRSHIFRGWGHEIGGYGDAEPGCRFAAVGLRAGGVAGKSEIALEHFHFENVYETIVLKDL